MALFKHYIRSILAGFAMPGWQEWHCRYRQYNRLRNMRLLAEMGCLAKRRHVSSSIASLDRTRNPYPRWFAWISRWVLITRRISHEASCCVVGSGLVRRVRLGRRQQRSGHRPGLLRSPEVLRSPEGL
jgi:hypothetical protein